MIKCECTLAYAGKTPGPFKIGISEHKRDIRSKDFRNPVVLYFSQAKQSIESLNISIQHVQRSPGGSNISFFLTQLVFINR